MSSPAAGLPLMERASGNVAGFGRIRVRPDDFRVSERLGFSADGFGAHILLRVLKQRANTMWVARELAHRAAVNEGEVGFAGLKDRHAITEQYFTVPARSQSPEDWLAHGGEGYRVLEAALHSRKLRRGSHRGNSFDITVRELDADRRCLQERLSRLGDLGVPNYFGPQRFGHNGMNLALARRQLAEGRLPRNRTQRSMMLSAARAAIFNNVLSARVRAGTWNSLQPGDVANLDGSGSVFPVTDVDEILAARCARLDLHPTGPLWGAGDSRVRGAVQLLEGQVAAEWPELCRGLEAARLGQERRALRVRVEALHWSFGEDWLRLQFALPRGAFATAVVHELLDVDAGADLNEAQRDEDW